ncbi:MAG: PorP/SprF family type IX secretion system membrane protein [Luteibaculum sp.]
MRPFKAISKLTICFSIFGMGLWGQLYSQDVHFTQFDASPLSLNPANTGNFNGFWRFSANYRNQWRVLDYPFVSYSAGYERNLEDKNSPFSLGLYILHDESGIAELSYNKFIIPLAVAVGKEDNRISFGIQPSYVNKRLNTSRLTFPNQYDPNTGLHDPSFANGETIKNSIGFFDLHAGIAWQRVFNGKVLKMGVAGFHLTQPNESFTGNEFKTPIRKVAHVSFAFPVKERWVLMPKALVHEQTKASEYLFGNYSIHLLGPNAANVQSVFVGILGRFGINRNLDAMMAVLGVNYERWDFGISYDINTSSLKSSTNGRGAVELSVIFWNGKVRLNRTTIICERF